MRRARQRDAAAYIDYGYTRPDVMSRGPVPQAPGTARGGVYEGPVVGAPAAPPAPIQQPEAIEPPPAAEPVPLSDPLTSINASGVIAASYAEPLPTVNAIESPTPPASPPMGRAAPAANALPPTAAA